MIPHASLFSQIGGFFDRNQFARLVSDHCAEKNTRGFKSWDHFVSVLFCQIAQAKSLRQWKTALGDVPGPVLSNVREVSEPGTWHLALIHEFHIFIEISSIESMAPFSCLFSGQ